MGKRVRPAAKAAPKASKAVALEELDADAFMRGDFLDEHTAESSGDDNAADGRVEGEDSSASEGEDDDSENDDDAPGALGADSDGDSDNEDDAASHAAQLRALSEKDPEFFEYLQGEEPDLLAFDPAELEGSDSEEEGEGDAAGATDSTSGSKNESKAARLLREADEAAHGVVLTMELLRAMQTAAFLKRTVKGLKRLLLAFRSGCHLGDEVAAALAAAEAEVNSSNKATANGDADSDSDSDSNNDDSSSSSDADATTAAAAAAKKASSSKTATASSSTAASSKEAAAALQAAKEAHVAAIKTTKDDFHKAAKRSTWRALQPMLYGFMKSLLHVIGQLKDKELLAFVARSLQHYTVFMIPFPKKWLSSRSSSKSATYNIA
eukprot:17814-Heterococcus_DN1.PRE.2